MGAELTRECRQRFAFSQRFGAGVLLACLVPRVNKNLPYRLLRGTAKSFSYLLLGLLPLFKHLGLLLPHCGILVVKGEVRFVNFKKEKITAGENKTSNQTTQTRRDTLGTVRLEAHFEVRLGILRLGLINSCSMKPVPCLWQSQFLLVPDLGRGILF